MLRIDLEYLSKFQGCEAGDYVVKSSNQLLYGMSFMSIIHNPNVTMKIMALICELFYFHMYITVIYTIHIANV